MFIESTEAEVTYTLTLNQQELDMIEAVLAQVAGAKGLGNRLAAKLEDFRTERGPYSIKVDGIEFRAKGCMGITYERTYEDRDEKEENSE